MLDDGNELAFTDIRRFARIRLIDDPPNEPPLNELGFDPILDMPKLDKFIELVSEKKGNVKGILLDQSFIAGIGNWIADEVRQ